MNGDTVSDWANQRIVEKRLKIDVIREGVDLRVVRLIDSDGIAAHAGLHKFDSLTNPTTNARAVLSQLSDPAITAAGQARTQVTAMA